MTPLFACFPVCLTFVAIGIVGLIVVGFGMYNRTPLEDRPDSANEPSRYGTTGPPPWWTLPLPVPDNVNSGKGEPAVITVVTSEGATVMFDDLASEQTGTRHSFTTRPIASGVQTRVLVKVNGPGGASSVSIGVRSGEKATVDMRK